jgi:hypothetical protein
MKWMSGATKRQRDRALRPPRRHPPTSGDRSRPTRVRCGLVGSGRAPGERQGRQMADGRRQEGTGSQWWRRGETHIRRGQRTLNSDPCRRIRPEPQSIAHATSFSTQSSAASAAARRSRRARRCSAAEGPAETGRRTCGHELSRASHASQPRAGCGSTAGWLHRCGRGFHRARPSDGRRRPAEQLGQCLAVEGVVVAAALGVVATTYSRVQASARTEIDPR